jgi:hypothetical protein
MIRDPEVDTWFTEYEQSMTAAMQRVRGRVRRQDEHIGFRIVSEG